MTKERLQIYIDPEHREALEELKELLAVEDSATDSALIRYIILELYRLKTKENIQMRALLNRLDELLIYSNSFAETMDVDIFDLENSEKYKEVKAQQRGKWANSRRKKAKNKSQKRPVNNQKDSATDSALIRYIILELYRLKTKENIQMRALLNRLDELLIYSNSFAETMDVDIFDLENSEKYKEVKAQQRGKWANSRRKKAKNKSQKRPVNNQKEKAKEEKINSESLTYNDLIAKYL